MSPGIWALITLCYIAVTQSFFLISYDAKFKSIAILDMKFRFTCGEWKLCEFCKILKYFEKDCIVCVQRSMAELLIAPDSIHKNS